MSTVLITLIIAITVMYIAEKIADVFESKYKREEKEREEE